MLMGMAVVVTAIVTFVGTATWQLMASRKMRETQRLAVYALIAEMGQMARQLGYKDLNSYLQETKGDQRARTVMENIARLCYSFTDHGACR